MYRFFKNLISNPNNKKLVYKTTSFLCLSTSLIYIWKSNSDNNLKEALLKNTTIYAFENKLEKKKLECKKLVKRFKVNIKLKANKIL
jgi:hypothetical protein